MNRPHRGIDGVAMVRRRGAWDSSSPEHLNALAARWIEAHYTGQDQCASWWPRPLTSLDHCNVLFRFENGLSADRGLIHFHDDGGGAANLAITRNLQFALGNMGYGVREFRKAAGNMRPAIEYLQRSARRRRPPILSWQQLNHLIDSAGSNAFVFCLHAAVPIAELILLDLNQPVTFDGCRVGCLDPVSGMVHSIQTSQPVTVRPEDGRFASGNPVTDLQFATRVRNSAQDLQSGHAAQACAIARP